MISIRPQSYDILSDYEKRMAYIAKRAAVYMSRPEFWFKELTLIPKH